MREILDATLFRNGEPWFWFCVFCMFLLVMWDRKFMKEDEWYVSPEKTRKRKERETRLKEYRKQYSDAQLVAMGVLREE